MDKKDTIRSPFFYVGDKYKLMPQLKNLFPNDINNYILYGEKKKPKFWDFLQIPISDGTAGFR